MNFSLSPSVDSGQAVSKGDYAGLRQAKRGGLKDSS